MSNETNNNEYLLKVDHLKQYFPVHDGFKKMELKAVDDVSFAIKPGETLGLVGESGWYRRKRVRPTVVFPQPDSPTSPSVSPTSRRKSGLERIISHHAG